MSTKQDAILGRFGANLAESMGATRQAGHPITPAAATTSDRHEGTSRLRAGAEIQLDRIIPDPDQPRTEFDAEALDRLAASLQAHGQLQPISVRWSDEAGRYLIIAGERRWRAARKAGKATIAAVIIDGADAGRILEMQLVENCLREDLQPIEQAKAFRVLMDRNGWTGARLADSLRLNAATVSRALALLDLPCTVQDAVASGALPPSVAYEVSKISGAEAQVEVAAQAVAGGMSRAEVVRTVKRSTETRKLKGRGAKSKPRATSASFRTLGGKLTLENRKGLDDALIIASLKDVLAQVEARLSGSEAA